MSQTSGLEGRIEGNKSNSSNPVFQVFLGGALLSSKITQEPPSPRRLGGLVNGFHLRISSQFQDILSNKVW